MFFKVQIFYQKISFQNFPSCESKLIYIQIQSAIIFSQKR